MFAGLAKKPACQLFCSIVFGGYSLSENRFDVLDQAGLAPEVPGRSLRAARVSHVRTFDQRQCGGAIEVR